MSDNNGRGGGKVPASKRQSQGKQSRTAQAAQQLAMTERSHLKNAGTAGSQGSKRGRRGSSDGSTSRNSSTTANGDNNNVDESGAKTVDIGDNSSSGGGDGDLSQLVELEFDPHKSTLAHTSFNYINSILGSGIIGMPYAIQQAGVGLGLILIILVALLTDYSLSIMIRSGELSGTNTYQGLMNSAFGKVGFYLLSILQLIYPCIAMISYNVIVGDTFTKVLGAFTLPNPSTQTLERDTIVLAATLLVTLPLSLYRNVSKLSRVSFLSLLAIGFIIVAILIRAGSLDIESTASAWTFGNSGLIRSIGIFSFAFMCHHNTFMLYGSMKTKTAGQWNKVTHISVGTSLVVSILFALIGYGTFTGMVQGDLLENYCWDDDLINVARAMFAVTIMLTFPLECFVARDVLEQLFFKEKAPSTLRHFGLTFGIVMTSCFLSMTTDCLGVTLELNGLLAAIPLAYILPALCFIRLEPSRFLSKAKLPAITTAIFGTFVSLTGLIILIANGTSSGNCTHGGQLPYCSSSIGGGSTASIGPANFSIISPSNNSTFDNEPAINDTLIAQP